jgi:ligand-binding sensor domain-containing protein/signal transduction histidine kinase/DNA-binding response OmpR family regulator
MATHDGLNKYDGHQFTVYRHSAEDTTSILDNMIRKVYSDQNGGLWIGTAKGLSFYDSRKDRFLNFPTHNMAVTGIAETGVKDRLMIAAGGDLSFFNTSTFTWDIKSSIQHENLGATIMYRNGSNIWIGTAQKGIFCYNTETDEFKKISSFTSRCEIQCMIMTEEQYLWVATEGEGLYRLNIINNELTNYRESDIPYKGIGSNHVRTLSTDVHGRLWVGTVNGVSILDKGRFINYTSDPFEQGSLSHSSVRCIIRDNQGGMWLGTWFGGINYWHPLKNIFRKLQRQAAGSSLNDNVISCMKEDSDKSIWIGTNSGGVNHYNPITEQFTYYALKKYIKGEEFGSNDVKSIYIDQSLGKVFVGTHAGGLSVIDKKTGHVQHCDNHTKNDVRNIYAIEKADENHLWIGTLKGLKRYDIRTKSFEDATDIYSNPISDVSIRSIITDSKGRLWVGGEDGVILIRVTDNGDCNITRMEALDNVFVQSIYESSTNRIWIASRQGLFCVNENDWSLTRYSCSEGLPSDIIYGIEEDSFGRLWMSTDNGISCFNPYSNTFRNFTVADGLQSNKFTFNSHCRRSNGELMFGGINGITAFVPEKLEDNPYTPLPIFTSLHVSNKLIRPETDGILEENITISDKLSLRHDQNTITLGFSVTNYLSGSHNSFAYTLEGHDTQWHNTTGNSATYSNLPHGSYRFLLKAANNDGKWNKEPIILKINIKPIWYQSTLAKSIYLLLFMIIIFTAYKFIVNRKEKASKIALEQQKKIHQEELNKMRNRFFIGISHEMRTPLTLIINPLSEMISQCGDSKMRKQLKYLERNAKRLMHLVNQIMDYKTAESGTFKLKVRHEDGHRIIKENWTFYETLAISKKLKYTLDSSLEGEILNIDGQYLELILNYLLSYAFEFTEKGEISVKAFREGKHLMLTIHDTGMVMPKELQESLMNGKKQSETESSPIGLALVYKLVELHHGMISVNSNTDIGTIFTVSLPLDLETYSSEEFDKVVSDIEEIEEVKEEIRDESSKRGRILIAEADEDTRNYMKNGLSSIFDIDVAGNGEDALQIIKETEPDLIVTAMIMPGIDGKKLCSHIKQNSQTSHIPIIMISAKTDRKDELDALKAGADDFLAKPFSMAILIARIRNIRRAHHRIMDKVTKSMEIAPEKISFNAMDEQFLNKAIEIVKRNIDNTDFSTAEFASAMNMSRSNLHIKLKALTEESALDFIRKIRFNEACRLLKDGRYSISEISDMVGFNTPSYFATCFKKYMGCLPTEYVKKNSH